MNMAFPPWGVGMSDALQAEGIHHSLFRPPVPSPASSSACLPAARVDAATPKRKRGRADDPLRALYRRYNADGDGDKDDDDDDDDALFPPRQRAYALAGQLDTPGGGDAGPDDSGILGESMYSDSNYRRALGRKRPRDEAAADAATDPYRPTPLFALPAGPAPSHNWSTIALSTIGGVVSRVWDFCRAGAFSGFSAGGGRGYGAPTRHGGDAPRVRCGYMDDEDDHHVPGYFPQPGGHGHADEAEAESRASTLTAPAAKRRQTGPADELGRNWVMVKEPRVGADGSTAYRQEASSHRPLARSGIRSRSRNRNQGPAVTTGRRISTPVSRRVSRFAASPFAPEAPRPASTASFASPRSPSPSKKSADSAASTSTAVGGSSANSPPCHLGHGHGRRRTSRPALSSHASVAHRRAHSNATVTSSCVGADEGNASPRLDAEAKKLAARRKMEERDADVRMAAFNKRLQDMIRQGKEALGTTVEVDGGWDDADD